MTRVVMLSLLFLFSSVELFANSAEDPITVVLNQNMVKREGFTQAGKSPCSIQVLKDSENVLWLQFYDGSPSPYNIQYVTGFADWSMDSAKGEIQFKSVVPRDIVVTIDYDLKSLNITSATSSWTNDACKLH